MMKKKSLFIALLLTIFSIYIHAQCTNTGVRPGDSYTAVGWKPVCNGGTDGFIRIGAITSNAGNNVNRYYSARILTAIGGTMVSTHPIPGNATSFDITGLPAGNYVVDIIDQCGNTSADKAVTIPVTPVKTINWTGSYLLVDKKTVTTCGDTYTYRFSYDDLIGNGETFTFTITNNLGATILLPINSTRIPGIGYGTNWASVDIPHSFFNGADITVSLSGNLCSTPVVNKIISPPTGPFKMKPGGGGVGIQNVNSATNQCVYGYNLFRKRQLGTNLITATIVETVGGLPAYNIEGNLIPTFNGNVTYENIGSTETLIFSKLKYNTSYTITYTDACGLVDTEVINYAQPPFATVQPASCLKFGSGGNLSTFLDNAGTLRVNVSDADILVPPLTFTINSGPATWTSALGLNPVTTNIVYPITAVTNTVNTFDTYQLPAFNDPFKQGLLPPGTYNVTYTDACGHTSTTNATITAACSPQMSMIKTLDYCSQNNGTVNLNYYISPLGAYDDVRIVLFNSSNAIIASDLQINSSGVNFNGLAPGTYKVRFGGVKYDNHNEIVDYIGMPNMPRLPGGFIYEETIVISPLAPLSFSSIATCNGTTTGVAIGGTAPYTYTLYDASGTTVVQPTQPTGSFSGLTVGATYQMRATDTCGRTFNQSFVVAASVLAPTIGIVVQQSCTAPVSSVQLSDLPDGDWIITDSLGGVTFNGTGSTTTLNNLPAGVHTFTVTSGTCTSSASASVTMSPATISGMDSDNDGVDNACDLDDDNDGILDIDEQTCLSSISIGVNPNPVASESYGETIATYTEVSGSVRPITFGGYNGFEPSYPSKVRIDYSKNFINYAFRVADMDNLEKVRLYVYDKTGALITNLLPYVTYKGSGINATTGTGYSLTIEATSDAGGVSNSFDPANYIDFKIPIEISRIDFEYFDRSAVSGASMTPEYYFLSGCVAKDTDGDGIPDYLDLDSDNDGCLDAIEGGANITASQLTTATGTVIVGTGSTASNQNLGNTVGNTATTMGVPTIVGTGQSVGQSQSFAKNDCLDSDGDGIPDWDDVDDDNDGILDTAECSNTITDLANAYSGGALKNIAPSDFGLALNVKHQNVTKDLSSKFGYPANSGAVIISIKNASVHPTADAWWTKNGEQPSVWNVTGTMSAFVLMAQNTEYYGNDSKTIHIYDSTPVIPITLPGLENQTPVAGQWSIVDTPTQKTLNDLNTDTSYQEYGNWRYANMNFGAKSFGFSTTTAFAEPTYAVMMYLECDADMDGVPNRLDLDSDADGCSDAMEGGASITESQLVTAGGTVNGGSTAVNQNLCASSTCVSTSGSNIGLPQLSPLSSGYSNNTGQTVGDSQNALVNSCPSPCAITATNPDSDGDGISDACDLDSDNDGILDTNEGRCSIPTKTTTWTTSAGGSASVTVTSTATVPGIKFTSAPQVLGAANNTSAISFANHTFNPTNFWYTPGIAGSPSLQFDQFWDINQEDADTAASYDAGKRTITIVFPSPINKLLFNIDRLGGNGTINPGVSTRYTNSTEFTMISLNFMMTKLAGNPQFIVTADKFYREPYVDIGIVSPGGEATPASGLPASYGTAAGTVEIKKTDGSSFTTVVFSTTGIGAEGLGDDAMEVILEGCTDRDTDLDGTPDYLDLDSDNDGCSDALEGGASITEYQLVTAGGTVTGGTSTVNQNLCASSACVSASGSNIGLPQILPLPTGYSNTTGQTVGNSINALVNDCLCYESPEDVSAIVPVNHGISALGRAGAENGNWPMLRNSAYTALEAKTKGFVVTRTTSPETTIAIPVVGMMVFDTDEDAGKGCLKIYTGSGVGEGWKCFTTQGCPPPPGK